MLSTFNLQLDFGCSLCSKLNGSPVSLVHKLYSMQMILIHIKANPFVKYGHLFPEYAASLVAYSEYYYCHWILQTAKPHHI